jgi:methionyl-tRNA formyltransferase
MQISDIRIILMGTPDFAVASLDALIQAGCNIVAVVTAPDKPAGRGMQLQQSAVKQYAVAKQIPVLQPELKIETFIASLKALQPHLQIVVAFRMLPVIVWSLPPMGTINLHGSLLTQYSGAVPINWAIINGETTTGVTSFKLQNAIDTGNILLQEPITILPNENAGQLHDKMIEVGAALLVKTIQQLASGTLKETPQSELISAEAIKHAPKIFTETCLIKWEQPAVNIYNLIRGLSPYPGAFTHLDGKKLKIYEATIDNSSKKNIPAGTFVTDGKSELKIAALDGWLHITDLQLEGKRRMDVASFLRGYRHLLN